MFEKANVRGFLREKLMVMAALKCGIFVFIQLKNRSYLP
jgi:hypothetical protein